MSTVRPIAPGAVRWIVRTLEEAGYETWAVGGAVRDALMGRTSVDWDLATKATPKQVRRIFSRTVPVGICLLYTSPSPRDQRGSRMACWA